MLDTHVDAKYATKHARDGLAELVGALYKSMTYGAFEVRPLLPNPFDVPGFLGDF
jgi:hypothetical protein